jgi:glucose-1-phosphate adenylyltransferase
MDFGDLIDAHVDRKADISIAAQAVTIEDASAMGIFGFDRSGQIVMFEEKPKRDRLEAIGQSLPEGARFAAHNPEKPFVASMGIYVFSRDVLLDMLEQDSARDFGREVIPSALGRYRVTAYMFRGYWADVGTVDMFYDANIRLTRPGAAFRFYDPHRPIYTHPRFLPGCRFSECTVREAIVAEGCFLDRCRLEESIVGIRTTVQRGAHIRRSVLLGADYYEADDAAPARGEAPRLGVGQDVVLDRVIVDKNARIGDGARLVNESGVEHADGRGYYIRKGIIVVPKDGVIQPGTTV